MLGSNYPTRPPRLLGAGVDLENNLKESQRYFFSFKTVFKDIYKYVDHNSQTNKHESTLTPEQELLQTLTNDAHNECWR